MDGLVAPSHAWSAATTTTLAILDDHFLQAVRRWPRLVSGLLERAGDNHDRTLVQLAIAQQPRVEDRLVVLFRLLADQWGRVTTAGIVLPMSLTHEALGRLIGARRPTVTLALKSLAASGRLMRQKDGAWFLRDVADLPAGVEHDRLSHGNVPRPLEDAHEYAATA
jgi:CRP-like cAMP-binding protein